MGIFPQKSVSPAWVRLLGDGLFPLIAEFTITRVGAAAWSSNRPQPNSICHHKRGGNSVSSADLSGAMLCHHTKVRRRGHRIGLNPTQSVITRVGAIHVETSDRVVRDVCHHTRGGNSVSSADLSGAMLSHHTRGGNSHQSSSGFATFFPG